MGAACEYHIAPIYFIYLSNNWGDFLAQQQWQGGVKPTCHLIQASLTLSSLRRFSSTASMKEMVCKLHIALFFSP